MTSASIVLMTRTGIRTYTYELPSKDTGHRLANIINDTMDALDPNYGERLVSVEVY